MRPDQRGRWRGHRGAPLLLLACALAAGTARPAEELSPRATFPKPAATILDPERHSIREVVVKFHEGTRIRLRNGRLVFDATRLAEDDLARLTRHDLTPAAVRGDVERANELLFARTHGTVAPLFTRPEDELDMDRARYQSAAGEELADLNLYFMFVLPEADAAVAADTIDALNTLRSVEISYAEPLPAQPAVDIAPPTAINLVASQGYFDRAQNGIDAPWAWRLPGGRGAGIRVIDIESGWDKDHEDLPGSYFAEHGWNFADGSHGAAVLGVLAAADNAYGATGLVPDVALGLSSPIWSTWYSPHNSAAAVDNAASKLRSGDVLVVEQHYPEATPPGVTCVANCTQFGYLPAESVQAVYDSIRLATAKGIVVVEAAGNGSMNLDDPFYNGRFTRSVRDSRAVIVGAGGSNSRNAWVWSNFGSRVDVQGWGDNVATLGYGDGNPPLRANGGDHRQWYTMTFSGTSSATPIVAGAAAAVNGYRLAHGDPLLDSLGMRQWLVATGTAQPAANAATNPIGPLPDLSRLIPAVGGRVDEVRPNGVARGWTFHSAQAHNSASIGVHFYVDGPAGSGTWAGSGTANLTRPDVNTAYNVTGSHGFEHRIPDAFRDDASHTLFAHGIDPSGPQRHVLLDNQVAFTLPNVQGTVDGVDANGRVSGWAYAAQSSWQSINVHAYVDGAWNAGGTFAGAFTANAHRPDVNAAFGITGSHGVDFTLPTQFRDGQPHTLFLYGIDPRAINNPLLGTRTFILNLLPAPALGPSTLDFGRRTVGTKTVLPATLWNGGPGPLTVGSPALWGGSFLLDSKTCGSTLAAGASCVFKIAFQPTAAGHSTGVLRVATPNAASAFVQIALQGEAGVPQAQLDTTALAFGPVNQGASITQTVRLSNIGTVPVTIASVSTWGGAGFSHTGCPTTIAAGSSCQVTVTFKPTTVGWRGAWLRFDDNGGGPHDVWLEGTGVAVGIPTPVPTALAFGSTDVGRQGTTLNATIYNTGSAALNVYGSRLAGPHWDDFRIAGNACVNGVVLQPSSSGCTLSVVFTPRATGPRSAKVYVSTSNGQAMIDLAGTGTAPLVATEWPAFGREPAHGGWNAEETGIDTQTVAALHEAWTAPTNALVGSSAALADGVAVFGDDSGVVHAVDAVTGKPIWDFATSDAVRSSPAIADGLVIVGSNDDSVYALEVQGGALLWTFATQGDVIAAPTVADGVVFVGSTDGHLYAVDLATGKPIWSDAIGAPVLASPAAAGHVLFAAADNHQLRAYEAATGTLLWTGFLNGPVRSSPAVAHGRVFVGSDAGRVYAFDAASGYQAWSYQMGGPVVSSPAVAHGFVYAASDTEVIAFDAATGLPLWAAPFGARSALAAANGVVYAATTDGFLRALDAWAGTVLVELELKIAGSSPAVAEAAVYVGTPAGLIRLQP